MPPVVSRAGWQRVAGVRWRASVGAGRSGALRSRDDGDPVNRMPARRVKLDTTKPTDRRRVASHEGNNLVHAMSLI
jgi:hypothetical protein